MERQARISWCIEHDVGVSAVLINVDKSGRNFGCGRSDDKVYQLDEFVKRLSKWDFLGMISRVADTLLEAF